MRNTGFVIHSLLFAAVTLVALYPQSGRTESDSESQFLLFPYVKTSLLDGLASGSNLDSDDIVYGIDLFGEQGKRLQRRTSLPRPPLHLASVPLVDLWLGVDFFPGAEKSRASATRCPSRRLGTEPGSAEAEG